METLREWLLANRGFLHPDTKLVHEEEHGSRLLAARELRTNSQVMRVPHSIALSCLNAMVDESLPFLKANASSFTVEALGVLYLMSQWLDRDNSFWKPYLAILPTPEQGFNTPFWFDDDDMRWLHGTDLLSTYESLRDAWHKYWRDDTQILHESGMDVSQYTWELSKWAATVFNSRSLSSRAVTPQGSKYWTAYRQGPSGRQTVLLDFSKVPQERKEFPVLVPIMDCLNHDPRAEVDWAFEPGEFVLSLHKGVSAGDEVFNNYGPKSNSELLMGYGFCIEDNPHDCVFETLKAPPRDLHRLLREIHPGYFTTQGKWNSEAATFRLVGWVNEGDTDVWSCMPVPLLELFYYIIQFERGLPVAPIDGDVGTFLLNGPGRSVLPRMAFYIVSSLMPKINKITQAGEALPAEAKNLKQKYAKMYRDGQLAIMHSLREGLTLFNRQFRPDRSISSAADARSLTLRSYFLTLDEALHVLENSLPIHHSSLLAGMQTAFSSQDFTGLGGSDKEQLAWVLFLSAALVTLLESDADAGGLFGHQMRSLMDTYEGRQYACATSEPTDPVDAEAQPFFDLLQRAAQAAASEEHQIDIWNSTLWTPDLVLDWGLRIAQCQGMQMRLSDGQVRYVVYFHINEDV